MKVNAVFCFDFHFRRIRTLTIYGLVMNAVFSAEELDGDITSLISRLTKKEDNTEEWFIVISVIINC